MNQNREGKPVYRESGVVQRLRKSVREIPARTPHVLLACSGGKDSVALASLLAELRRLGLVTFSIAHIHHGQHHRADLAAKSVEEIGRILDVPVTVQRLEQSCIDAHIGVGLEEGMRRERYLVLANIAAGSGADCIALAHHQTDQTETILLHLIRGAGVDGLAGMREWEPRRIPWWEQGTVGTTIGLWRPLIGESAGEVSAIARESGLPVVDDPTNSDPKYRRNAIRHRVIPVLEEIAEGSTAAIAGSAETIARDVELLAHLTRQHLHDCLIGRDLSRSGLVAMPAGLRERVVRAWMQRELPQLDLTADRVAAIVMAAERNRGGTIVQLGGGHTVTLRGGMFIID